MKKFVFLAMLAAIAGLAGWGEPYWVAGQVRSTLEKNDVKAFSAKVDMPAIKAHLHDGAGKAVGETIASLGSVFEGLSGMAGGQSGAAKPEPREKKNDGFAGKAAEALVALADMAIGVAATPEALMSAMATGSVANMPGSKIKVSADWHVARRSFNEFAIEVADRRAAVGDAEPLVFVYKREGLVDWKLVDVE